MSASWFKYANWLSMSQFEKGGVIESMVLSDMILQGDLIGLWVLCKWLWMLSYLTYGYTLRLYELSVKYYVYIYTLML